MKKIERGTQFVSNHLALFQCPVCQQGYEKIVDHSLVCPQNHTLDVNKKGSLNFLNRTIDTEYDDAMLVSRRHVLSEGLFDGIVAAVSAQIKGQKQTILDIGTGEGTPLAKLLAQRQQQDVGLGFDISKAGINLATQLETDAFYMVADLAHLPFMAHRIDTIVEFFSPSAYDEFRRVLKPNGRLIKVIPNAGYLHELRERLYPENSKNHTYSNEKVLNHFLENYPQATQQQVRYTWSIPNDCYVDLLHMTPLHWGARPETQRLVEATPLNTVTVDVTVLVVDQVTEEI